MHGSLISTQHRLSLSGHGSGILSSSEHTLTDDETTRKISTDIQPIVSLTEMNLKRSNICLDDLDETGNEKKPRLSITRSADSSHWKHGYKNDMLTFYTICLFAFMTGVEYAVILPTAFEYVKTMTNVNIYVGLILSAYSISGSIAGIIMGKISDMTGKVKILILISTMFEICGGILYFVANNIHTVLLGRLIAGVGMGVVPPILADVAHRTTESERTKAISIILGCRQLGLLIGPCFTILIRLMNFHIGSVHVHNLNGPGFLMASVWLILIVVCWFCFHDRTPSSAYSHSTDDSLKHKYTRSDHSSRQDERKVSLKTYREQYIRIEMFVLFLGTFITYFNQTALETIVAAFTEQHFQWTTVHISVLFVFAGLEIIVVYVCLVQILSKRFEDRMLLIFGFIALALACILGTFFTWASYSFNWFGPTSTSVVNKRLLSLFIAFVFLDLLGLPFIAATSVSLFTKLTIKELQGFSQGIQRSMMGIGTIVGPLFASSLLNRLHIMMTTMLALSVLTLIATVIVIKRLRPPSKPIPSNDMEDTENQNASLKHESIESISPFVLPSKTSYVTLVHHDDERVDELPNSNSKHDSLTKRSSNHLHKISNGDI